MSRRGRLAGTVAVVLGLAAAICVGVGLSGASYEQAGPTGEMAERDNLKQAVTALFDKSDFGGLERLASYYRGSGARTPSGFWQLTVFYGAIHDLAAGIGRDDDKGWQQLSAKLADWQGRYPGKPTALMAQAIALKSYAWSMRPRYLVLEASTRADAKFRAALGNARDFMARNMPALSVDPHAYVLRADLATALGEAPDDLMSVIDEGRAKYPGYFALDFSGLDYFAVGDGSQAIGPAAATRIEAFAGTAAQRAGAESDERYARLYWHAYAAFYGNDLFKRSRVNWSRMRSGMQALIAHYPDAWNINSFAYLACLAGDRETTRTLVARLSERPILAVWQARPVFSACRQWASLDVSVRR